MTIEALTDVLQSIAIVGLAAQTAMLRRYLSKSWGILPGKWVGRIPKVPPPRPEGAPLPTRPQR